MNDGAREQPISAVTSDRASRYELIAQLDAGGMAEVHLALTRRFAGVEKLVVTKRLRPELACDEELVAMFLEEARLAARFRHPNVVQTYEVGEEDGTWFIAMEFLEGQSLSRLRREAKAQGGIPLPIHLEILSETLRGLDYAHELADFDGAGLQIVHRDMNPQNIFVCYDGDVKILDFGVAKAATSVIETRTGWLKGKISYMAPEQVCEGPVDRRADLFSMGAMVWEAATSRRLWAGAEEVTILRRIVQNDFPWLAPEPGVPRQVVAIYERALARHPDERFATAAEMQVVIEAYFRELGARPTRADVARYVTALFAEHRERLKRVIAAAMARRAAGQPSGIRAPAGGPTLEPATPGASSRPSVNRAAPAPTHAIVLHSPLATTLPPIAPREAARKWWMGAIAIGGAVVLAGAVGKWNTGRDAVSASASSRASELAEPSLAVAPKPASTGRVFSPERHEAPMANPRPADLQVSETLVPVGSDSTTALIFDAARAPAPHRVAARPDPNWLDPTTDVLRKKAHRRPLDARDPWAQ